MQVIKCDTCGRTIQDKIVYLDVYTQEGEKTKPYMPIHELCPICADSLRNNYKDACLLDAGLVEAPVER